MRKIIALLLSMIMLAGSFPLTALAEAPAGDLSDVVETEENAAEEDAEEAEDAGSDLELTLVSRAVAPVGSLGSNAQFISFGSTYTKSWTKNNDDQNHYAKFTLSQRGIVTLTTNKPLDSDGDVGRLDLTFYDAQGNVLYGNACNHAVDNASMNYTVHCGLEAGTYFIGISPKFIVKSGSIPVHYSVTFKANAYCETETNADAATADALALGHMYTAHFGSDGLTHTENADYFKFSVTGGHTYRITFDRFNEIQSTSTLISLVGASSTSIKWDLQANVDDQGRNYMNINPKSSGRYFIVLDNYSKAQFTYGIMVEDLTSSTHIHQYSTLITPPTCVSQGYTTHLCECGEKYQDNIVPATGDHTYASNEDTSCDVCGYIRYFNSTSGGTAAINAVNVTLGNWYHHGWTSSNDHRVHYAKFTIPQQGIVTLKVNKPLDDFGKVCKYDFTFFNSSSNEVFGFDCNKAIDDAKSYYEIHCGLKAGTYYVCMDPSFYVKSGVIDLDYTVIFQPTIYCETESNESSSLADPLEFDKMYTGFYGNGGHYSAGTDYYSYPAVAGHTYRISLRNFGALDSGSTILYHIGTKEESISYDMAEEVHGDFNSTTIKATETRTNYIYFDNFSGSQYQYGIMVSDITAGAHSHTYSGKVVAPTCSTEGYTLYTCDCGEKYMADYTATSDHNIVATPGYPATCTDEGLSDGQQCSWCNQVIATQETIPALGHDWGRGVVTLKPTLTEEGVRTFTCSACQLTRDEPIPVLSALRIPGDANDDASVDIMDALLTLQYAVGWDVEINLLNADVNADDAADILDALLILQYSVGWDIDLL